MFKMYADVKNIFKESSLIVPALKIIKIITNYNYNLKYMFK